MQNNNNEYKRTLFKEYPISIGNDVCLSQRGEPPGIWEPVRGMTPRQARKLAAALIEAAHYAESYEDL
jgi:hypothetical protein